MSDKTCMTELELDLYLDWPEDLIHWELLCQRKYGILPPLGSGQWKVQLQLLMLAFNIILHYVTDRSRTYLHPKELNEDLCS